MKKAKSFWDKTPFTPEMGGTWVSRPPHDENAPLNAEFTRGFRGPTQPPNSSCDRM